MSHWRFLPFMLLVFLSCRRDPLPGEGEVLPCQLRIEDSLTFSSTTPRSIVDSKDGRLLLYNIFEQTLEGISFSEPKIRTLLDAQGSGDKEYPRIRGASFFPDNKLIVKSRDEYLIYTEQGAFVQRGRLLPSGGIVNPTPGYSVDYFTSKEDTLIAFVGGMPPSSPVNSAKFWEEIAFFGRYRFSDQNFRQGGQLRGDDIYTNAYFFKNLPFIKMFKDEVYTLFPYTPFVDKYSVQDLKERQRISFNSSVFSSPSGVAFPVDSEGKKRQAFIQFQEHSRYIFFEVLEENTFLLIFEGPIPEHLEPIRTSEAYSQSNLKFQRDHYLQVVDQGKLIYECQFPDTLEIEYAVGTDELLLKERSAREKNTMTVFKAQLELK